MGYLHIDNLYKDTRILEFKYLWALEKIHGTSAHIRWKEGELGFYSGGEKHENFITLFDHEALRVAFTELGCEHVMIYGEAYGGKQQGMSKTYGTQLQFIVFDVRIGETWLDVVNAAQVAERFGLEFVPFVRVAASVEEIDAVRDLPSRVAVRRGITEPKIAEGVVLRPPFEVTLSSGKRLIAKHKRDEFRETSKPRVVDKDRLTVLTEAAAIADEWVTVMRLRHVLDKMPQGVGVEATGEVVKAMQQDIEREAEGEVVLSRDAMKAIGTRTAQMFKKLVCTVPDVV